VTRRGPIIAAVVSVALAALAVLLLVAPKMSQVKDTKDQLEQAQMQEDSLNAQLESLQEAQTNAPKTKEQIQKLESEVPPTIDLPALIRLLQEVRDRSAVDFFAFSPGTPALDASGEFSALPTTITVTGGYFSLEEFLLRLETLPRAAKVTGVSISPGGTAGTTETTGTALSLTMNLTVEFYTTDTSAGPGSIPGPTTGGAVATPGA
jgi:Tfp pilus assembly protein PilO